MYNTKPVMMIQAGKCLCILKLLFFCVFDINVTYIY